MLKEVKMEKRILWLSFWTGSLFALAEFFMAIYSGSQAVLMDAAYDASELLIVGLMLFLMPLFHRPITEKLPFGFAQLESILVIAKGLMLLSVTIGLSAKSVEVALSGGNEVDGVQISIFQGIVAVVSLVILIGMRRMNRSLSSPIINMEIYGWKVDVAYSVGMGIAFFASTFLKGTPLEWLSPYFDQFVSVLIVLFMLPEALKMLFRAIKDVILISPEKETMDRIKHLCGGVLEKHCLQSVFYDVTRTGRRIWVAVYFRTEGDTLSVSSLQSAMREANTTLAREFDNCTCELIMADPDADALPSA
ncbi:cation transporter [Bhargavaea ullalensis]|uniref:Co/Zn/Cd cation transporter (Cation efflux family) n=1 Tax=Bhargavaea ullalensis TaxID=1265685 RepID=A0ABV2G876_9BACL